MLADYGKHMVQISQKPGAREETSNLLFLKETDCENGKFHTFTMHKSTW